MLLNFAPTSAFHQPIKGNIHVVGDKVLIKARVTRPADTPGLASASIIELMEVIGPVKRLARFRRMSPFQYNVPIPEKWSGLASAIQNVDRTELERHAAMLLGEEEAELLPLPPPITSHFDYPMAVLGTELAVSSLRGGRPRKPADVKARLPWIVSFNDAEMPTAPPPTSLALIPNMSPEVAQLIRDLFDGRPIVTRIFAATWTRLGYVELARLLPVASYCFSDGPWRNCWVRYGVDPRKDPQYRIFQTVQCRNNLIGEGLVAAETSKWPAHEFHGDSASSHFVLYQFIDLHYPPLAELFKVPVRELQEICSKREGWYPTGTISRIRSIIRDRWVSIIQERNPEAWAQLRGLQASRATTPSTTATAAMDEAQEEEEEVSGEDDEDIYEFYDEE